MKEDSSSTAKWLQPAVRPKLRLYFFNMTNVEDFKLGAKPALKEVGPYVYE